MCSAGWSETYLDIELCAANVDTVVVHTIDPLDGDTHVVAENRSSADPERVELAGGRIELAFIHLSYGSIGRL